MNINLTADELRSMSLTLKKAERIANEIEYHGFVGKDKDNFAKLNSMLANIEKVQVYDIESIPDFIKQAIVDERTYQNIVEDVKAYCDGFDLDYSEEELDYIAERYVNGAHDSNASHWDNIASLIDEWDNLQKDDAIMDME